MEQHLFLLLKRLSTCPVFALQLYMLGDKEIMMTLFDFKNSLDNNEPPECSVYLQSLWHDGKGDWMQAHRIVKGLPDGNASWIHAYLHRKEGDLPNAKYWYDLAEKRVPDLNIDDEWHQLVTYFIQ